LGLFSVRGRLPAGRRPCEANCAPRFALRSPPLKHWRILARFRAKQALTAKQTQTSLEKIVQGVATVQKESARSGGVIATS